MTFPKSDYAYCKHDSIDGLAMPDADFWPIYSWCWSAKITEDGIVKRLDDMCKRGIRRIYVLSIPNEFTGIACEDETEYLSDEYMALAKLCNEKAKSEEMLCWLYDEDKWPSGFAGGLVTKNPEFRQRILCFSWHRVYSFS